VYVVDILKKSAELAARAAAVYRGLATRFQDDPDRVQLWRELALEEETHAEVLRREQRNFETAGESGNFLPDFVARLEKSERDLIRLEEAAVGANQLDKVLAVAVAVEQRDLEELYDDLVLQGEPAFRILAERVEAALSVEAGPPANAGLPRLFKRAPRN